MAVLVRSVLFPIVATFIAFCVATSAAAVEPDEILSDAAMESRARSISAELRCLVCQNQSIDDSNAPLARDLRILVRERLKAGDSDQAVKSFIVDRYGTYVLLRPPFSVHTAMLWLGPPILLLLTLAFLLMWSRRARLAAGQSPSRLSGEEEARLKALLGDEKRRAGADGNAIR
jgi:cytochrome c-type biogenesis protein CcmH